MEFAYKLLEEEYRRFVGAEFAVSCNSGTSALHLSLLAAGVSRGDEVIIPDWTMAAVAFACSYVGANVVCADVKPNGTLDPKYARRKVSKRTKAIIAVDTYGRLADMEELSSLAYEKNLVLIEDACEAQGAANGLLADFTCWSFYRNKIIHAEEGGMVTTNNEKAAERMRFLKNMAFSDAHDYYHTEIGYNYRLADTQAEMVLRSLRNFRHNRDRRREIEGWYNELFSLTSDRDAVWFYDYFCGAENQQRIVDTVYGARHVFKPISSFPMYKQQGGSVAAFLSKNIVLLPVEPSMTKEEVQDIYKLCQ